MEKEYPTFRSRSLISDNIFLVKVPKNQIEWFKKQYGFLTDYCIKNVEFADWGSLTSTIFGYDYRFLNYNGNSDSLIESFWMEYSCGNYNKQKAQYLLDSCLMAMKDCEELEYFELALNIKTVVNEIFIYIEKREK